MPVEYTVQLHQFLLNGYGITEECNGLFGIMDNYKFNNLLLLYGCRSWRFAFLWFFVNRWHWRSVGFDCLCLCRLVDHNQLWCYRCRCCPMRNNFVSGYGWLIGWFVPDTESAGRIRKSHYNITLK